MRDLAFILFLPWYVILGVLFWIYPRQPRNRLRFWLDTTALLVAMLAGFAGGRWAYAHADLSVGSMWQQIFASLVSYGLFVLVLFVAMPLRSRMLRGSTNRSSTH